MKYIDADKLIVEIESIINSDHPIEYNLMEKQAYNSALNDAINLIDSLQQEQPQVADASKMEQPELPGIKANGIPGKDFIPVEWVDACERYGRWKIVQQEQPEATCQTCGFYENNCPFIRGKLIPYPNKVCKDYKYSAMKEQEQAEVGLELEIERIVKDEEKFMKFQVRHQLIRYVARHFYELGKTARKEE